METKFWLNSKIPSFHKLSKLEQQINTIQIFNFGILCGIVIISFSLNALNSKFLPNGQLEGVFLNYLVLYSNMVPIFLFICLKLSRVFEAFRLKFSIPGFFLQKYNVLDNLEKVEYLLIEKSAILTEPDPVVSIFIIKDQFYIEEKKHRQLESTSENNYEYNLLCSNINKPALYEESLTFCQVSEKVSANELGHEEWFFFQCVSLFHESKLTKIKNNDDQVVASVLAKFGVFVNKRTSNYCEIESNGKIGQFQIVHELGYDDNFQCFKLVVMCKSTFSFYLLVKGRTDSVKTIINNENDLVFIEDLQRSEVLSGVKCILYAYKELTSIEKDGFVFDLNNALISPINVAGKVALVYEKYEKNSKYLGIVGLEYIISEENKQAIRNIKNSQIKP